MTRTERIDLDAYLDGELGPDEAAEIEARLEEEPDERARLNDYARHKALIGDALAQIDDDQPRDLRTARLERKLASILHRRTAPPRTFAAGPWIRSGAQIAAACALVTFGWLGHAQLSPTSQDMPEYVSEAVGAHQVFAEDMLYPAEFTGATIDGAAEWFSRKIGHPVSAPNLGGYDIALVGARLLGTKEGPLVQYIYEDPDGGRYSLTLARHPVDRPVAPVQVVDYPDQTVGYWSNANIDFALVGKKSGKSVHNIAANLADSI